MIALLLQVAYAQSCDSIYTNKELEVAIGDVDRLFGDADLDRALNVLRRTENLIPCMKELADKKLLGRFALNYAVISFLQQDSVQATRWGHFFKGLHEEGEEMDWGEHPAATPLQNILEMEPLDEPDTPGPKAGFAHPKNGAVFIDAAFVAQPEIQPGTPHLVQVFQKGGYLVEAYWQDGDVWKDGFVDESGPTSMPKFYDPATNVITPKGKPPPIPGTKKAKKAPIIPLIAGGGLLVASGVMYALAGSAKSKLKCNPAEGDTDCPTTSEELTALRSRANLLVFGSGIALVGGLGIGVTGILVEDEAPTLTISGRF